MNRFEGAALATCLGILIFSAGMAAAQCAPGGATACAPGPRHLTLILHNHANLDARIVDDLVGEASRIWRRYGIEIASPSHTVADPRAGVPQETVRVAIEAGPPGVAGQRAPGSLGWIEFLEGGRPGNVLHISVAAARRLLAEARLAGRRLDQRPAALQHRFLARALGRGLAHELGHYLLRKQRHTDSGLMRARFRADEMLTNGQDGFDLGADERALLQAPVTSGLRTAVQEQPGSLR